VELGWTGLDMQHFSELLRVVTEFVTTEGRSAKMSRKSPHDCPARLRATPATVQKRLREVGVHAITRHLRSFIQMFVLTSPSSVITLPP
jgi:hypothetical protein